MPFAQLENRGILTVSGSDREAFLQGLVSNDVSLAMQGKPVWAALLTPQGKYKHDFFIISDGDRLVLECEGEDRLIDLGRTLRRFVLRSDVTLGIEKDARSFVVWGDEAVVTDCAANVFPFAGGLLFPDPRLQGMGLRVLAPAESARKTLAELDVEESNTDNWHSHRISLGVPDGSRDLEVEKTILLEAGFDELNGVDWVKGCYMGQELTARTKYRGLVKRRLIPVSIDGGDVRPGDDVTADNRVIGTVKSVTAGGDTALSTLKLDAISGKLGQITAGDAVLTPSLPAWISLPVQDA